MTKQQLANKLNISLSKLYAFLRGNFFQPYFLQNPKWIIVDGIPRQEYKVDLVGIKKAIKEYEKSISEKRLNAQRKRRSREKYAGILKNKTDLTVEEYLKERKSEAGL